METTRMGGYIGYRALIALGKKGGGSLFGPALVVCWPLQPLDAGCG